MGQASRFPTPLPLAALLFALVPASVIPFAPAPAQSQIVINEILPNPVGDESNAGTERIEIYNAGATPVDMTGWAIDDAATIDAATVRCRIPEDFDTAQCPGGVVIGPGEFRVLKGTTAAAWLNNGGDDVYIVSSRVVSPTVIHAVTYPPAVAEGSVWAAVPNGSTNFAWRPSSTLCATNGGATGDEAAPATVFDLAAAPGAYPGEIRLTWTAPGDDGAAGTASAYEIKVAYAPITALNFDAAADINRWVNEPLPRLGGSPETLFVFGLDPDSTYHFALETSDEVPNVSGVSNSPSTAPLGGALLDPDLGYTPYFGNLHSHTSYSDGVLTPAAAYNYARSTAPTPLDFLAVTDHNHAGAGMSLPSYAQGRAEAASANSDSIFVAIWGQEWGLATNGHVNIFEAPVLFGWEGGNHDVFVAEGDYAGLYDAIQANPPTGYPAIAEWCHPTHSDFDNLQVTAAGQSVVHLMALVNGPSMSTATDESDVGNTGFDDEFQEALRKGYRVSPTADQDNHNATWGAATESRTAVLATAKTKTQILNAMAARRTYATQDHNAQVDFSAEGRAMGQAFSSALGIRIAAHVTDPDAGELPAQIDLFRGITGGGSVASRVAFNVGSATFQWRERETFAPGTEVHYYLRIRMADNQNIWTGPVYVTYDPAAPVAVEEGGPHPSGLSLAVSPNPARGNLNAVFALPRGEAQAAIVVYDLSGRRVRTLLRGAFDPGQHRVGWDGRDDDGLPVAAGIFFLRLETSAGSVATKALLLR